MDSMDPFKSRDVLAPSASQNHTETPKELTPAPYWNGVSFRLQNHLFIVNIESISSVFPRAQITPLPGVKSWVQGITHNQGRLLPVIDLKVFLGLPHCFSEASSHPILELKHPDISAGLLVDEIYGQQRVENQSNLKAVPDDLPDSLLPFTHGCYQQKKQYIVLDIEQLATSEYFLAAAVE